jgi:hypothetical protein
MPVCFIVSLAKPSERVARRVAKQVFKVGQLVEMMGFVLPMAHISQKKTANVLETKSFATRDQAWRLTKKPAKKT